MAEEKSSSPSLFDPSKITTSVQLLAGALLVVNVFAGAWLVRAEDSSERIVAGIVFAVLFLASIGVLIYVVRSDKEIALEKEATEQKRDAIQGIGQEITAASTSATTQEIQQPPKNKVAAPDGSYLVQQEPEGWTRRVMSYADWIAYGMRIDRESAAALIENDPAGRAFEDTKVLTFWAGKEVKMKPIIGTTTINGRKLPTVAEIIIPIRLSILPIKRFQPPMYEERTLAHNMLNQMSAYLNMGLTSLSRLTIKNEDPDDGKPLTMTAEMRQVVQNAVVDGKPDVNININITIIGIEGVSQDYLLILQYPSFPDTDDPSLNTYLNQLRELASSLQPLEAADSKERYNEARVQAEKDFEALYPAINQHYFSNEMQHMMIRLSGMDMDVPEDRLEAQRMIEPFIGWAESMGSDDLAAMRSAIDKAKAGDATEFIEFVRELQDEMAAVDEQQTNDLPPQPTTS